MIISLLILLPLALLALWFFTKSSPRGDGKGGVFLFNALVLAASVLFCGALTLKVYAMLAGGPDRAWWPVLSVLGSLLLFSACLTLGGLIRNLIVFPPRGTGDKNPSR
jgi:hypothetical protein